MLHSQHAFHPHRIGLRIEVVNARRERETIHEPIRTEETCFSRSSRSNVDGEHLFMKATRSVPVLSLVSLPRGRRARLDALLGLINRGPH